MELLTTEQLMEKLQVESAQTIYTWIRRKVIPEKAVFKLTKHCIRFRKKVIDEWADGVA